MKKLLALVALLTVCSISAVVQAKTYKISTLLPDGTFAVTQLKQAGKAIFEKTEGRVKIKIYPGGVMGSDNAVMRKIRIGQLHGLLATGGTFAPFYKEGQVYNAPMKFQTFDDVDKVRAQLDAKIVKGLQENGWQSFGLIENGFAYAMSSKKILSIEDLKSAKLWLPAGDPISEKIANAYDVPAIYLGIGDVLTALQTGAIDTIIAPPVAALTLQWYTKIKNVTDMPFMYTYSSVVMSKKHTDKIAADDFTIVQSELSKASTAIDKQNRIDNLNAFTALQSQGLKMLTLSEKEIASIKAISDSATDILIKDGEFSQGIYNELNTILAQ